MVPDKIEREIVIDAPITHVWQLVTQPGFWVNPAQAAAGDRTVGAVTVVTYDEGHFPVRVEQVDESRHYIAYRWANAFPNAGLTPGNSTLIEFTLSERGGQTGLVVVESGFGGLDAPEEVARGGYDDNSNGWNKELAKLRIRAEAR